MLRSRTSRREEPLGAHVPEPMVSREDGIDPEREALLAASVGLALLVVLETLAPAERVAFVLHDMFAVPFDEIAPIVLRADHAAVQAGASTKIRAVRRRWPRRSRGGPGPHNRRSSMEPWDSCGLRAERRVLYSASRSRAGRSSKSTWSLPVCARQPALLSDVRATSAGLSRQALDKDVEPELEPLFGAAADQLVHEGVYIGEAVGRERLEVAAE